MTDNSSRSWTRGISVAPNIGIGSERMRPDPGAFCCETARHLSEEASAERSVLTGRIPHAYQPSMNRMR
jgi:hypothetical protein